MDRAWLEPRLAAGDSIESIAREVGRHPSTVAYWVRKFGLASAHAARHAPRGGIARDELEALVAQAYTIDRLAGHFAVGATTVRHWLKRYGLTTVRTVPAASEDRPGEVLRRCPTHGLTVYIVGTAGKRYRCRLCRARAVSERRRRVKRMLVAEAGGACRLCGYDRYPGALQFHHVDPRGKSFAIADRGLARSLERARAEARKCILVCANCHAEIEAGLATIPKPPPAANASPSASGQHTGRG